VNSQLGPELSAAARRVISDAHGFDEPTAEDRERVKARWLASIAVAAGASSLSQTAHAATNTAWSLKAAGIALVVAAGAVGLYVALPGERLPGAVTSERAPADRVLERAPRIEEERVEEEKLAASLPSSESKPGPSAPGVERPSGVASDNEETRALAEADNAPTSAAPAGGVARVTESTPQPLPATRIPVAGVPFESGPVAARAMVSPVASSPVVGRSVAAAARPSAAPARATIARATAASVARNGALPSASAQAQPGSPEPGTVNGTAQAPVQSSQLSQELALLSQIRGSVQAGAAARALRLLTSYSGRFAQPILGMEAAALRIDALCQAGQRDAARASIEAFRGTWPGSPLEQRVNAACP
jgi:hypothetical protein